MLKLLLKLLKKVVIGCLILYTFNLIGTSLGIIIPINILTILITALLGLPGTLGLVVVNLIAFSWGELWKKKIMIK